ncbi:putative transcription factor C2H2 family [Helianthus debilis subsp. tardiflorus]
MEEDKQTDPERNIERNIVEMLRDDQASGSKKNWKAFRDKLRLKRTGKAWTSSVRVPTSDMPIQNNNKSKMMTRRGSWRYQSDESNESDETAIQSVRLLPLETDPEHEETTNEQQQAAGEGDQVLSLMALLSTDGSNYHEDEAEQHVEQHVEQHAEQPLEQHEEEASGDCNACSGCNGKVKGAALGPCGHMFCKQCTKELHVAKGNCPTCNDYILEILDIF